MSIWTHVNAVFRLDSMFPIQDEEIEKIFGKKVAFDDLSKHYKKQGKTKTLPMGSEGSLEMSIWHNPDAYCIPSTTVSIFGDLRDYDDVEGLKTWFDSACGSIPPSKGYWIRQAVIQINVEGAGETVVLHKYGN